MMKKSFKIIIILVVVLFVGVGAIIFMANRKSERFSIVATSFPAYDFARAVAGDAANVKMLIPPGVEIHDFEPTPQDIIDIEESDLFIYNGGESDEWVEGVVKNTKTGETFKMMDHADLLLEDGEDDEYDEHVWTSLKNAIKIINAIKDKLIDLYPENQKVFEENAKDYTDKLSALDSEYAEIVQNSNNDTLVFGDRFPLLYFVNDYGLDYLAAFPGCSEETEPSSETVATLIKKIKNDNIPVVFKLKMSGGSIAETIARETGAKILEFDAAHTISPDDFANNRTYLDIMKKNLEPLKEALE